MTDAEKLVEKAPATIIKAGRSRKGKRWFSPEDVVILLDKFASQQNREQLIDFKWWWYANRKQRAEITQDDIDRFLETPTPNKEVKEEG